MKASDQTLLRRIKKAVVDKAPSAKIYLYGSRVRGIAKPNSDWDLLILLDTEKITSEVEEKITSPLYDLEFDLGEVISPMIYTEAEWNTKYSVTPLYQNIMREAKLL